MKKLTKRVQISDLFIDVPKNTFHVVADSDGQLRAVNSKVTVIRGIDGWQYSVNDGGEVSCVCRVDLEGLNWWECCWFVGNQGDAEVIERRLLQAEGAAAVVNRVMAWDGIEINSSAIEFNNNDCFGRQEYLTNIPEEILLGEFDL